MGPSSLTYQWWSRRSQMLNRSCLAASSLRIGFLPGDTSVPEEMAVALCQIWWRVTKPQSWTWLRHKLGSLMITAYMSKDERLGST